MGNNLINAVIIESDETSKELLVSYLDKLGYINSVKTFVDEREGCIFAVKNHPGIVIIDLSVNTGERLEIIKNISENSPGSKIIAISYSRGTDVIIKALRKGAGDFLLKPIIEKEFITSVNKLKFIIENNVSGGSCKVFSVFSNKGGIGKTCVSINFAAEIANFTREKVALVDLNMELGDVTTFLDLSPKFDIPYIIENLDNKDENFIYNAMTQYKTTDLYILADPSQFKQTKEITPAQIRELIEKMKTKFSYIIIDTTNSFESNNLAALDLSDEIFLITSVNLPSLRNCQRCLELFREMHYENDKIKIVLNRYMENDEIQINDIENLAAKKVYWKIPNNYIMLMSAINKGLTVSELNASSNIAQNYKDFAAFASEKKLNLYCT